MDLSQSLIKRYIMMKKQKFQNKSLFMRKQLIVTMALLSGLPLGSSFTALAEPAAQSQSQGVVTINGTVLDENNEPLVGASVNSKGTNRGVLTNVDGQFTIKVKPGTLLSISYVGYKTDEVRATEGMVIHLTPTSEMLEQLVVVGYGSQKRANLTGAVSTVDVAKTLESRPTQDVAQALQGAVPGLTILNSSGDLNESVSIKIRGTGTLSNNAVSNPLIVVDGVPVDDMSYLNPSDIESISVLKDAASSSIYGSRAAFGVIMITTKSAKDNEKIQVKYSNNFGWDQSTFLPDYSDVPSQLRAALEAKANAGGGAVELFSMYFDQMLPYAEAWQKQNGGKRGYGEMVQYKDMNNVGDYMTIYNDAGKATGNLYYADWDILDIYYNNAAPSMNHNFTVQGTSGKTNYYMSFGYDEKEGTQKIRPEERKRWTATANVSTWFKNWIQFGARINFTRRQYTKPETYNNTYQYLWRWGSFFIPSGYIVDPETGEHNDFRVMAMRKQAFDREYVTDRTRMTAFIKANLYDGLTLNADFTYGIQNHHMGWADHSIYGMNWSGTAPQYIVSPGSCGIFREMSKQNSWTLNVYANWSKTFANDHNINVMAGANAEEREWVYLSGERSVLLDENYPELNLAETDGQTNGWSHTHSATAGYFGRINYDYKGIYLLELNGRYDGSSSFPRNDHWAFFPSGSLGYRFSEEKYFEPIKDTGILTNGKLRASYGEIGNEAVGNNMFISTISQISSSNRYWNESNRDNSLRLNMYNMPTTVSSVLTWERIRTIDVGIDLGFLSNELVLGFDWYKRDNTNMLAVSKTLPAAFGAGAPYTNAGALSTKGWEFSASYNHKFGDFEGYVNFNIGDAVTKITKWDNENQLLNTNYTGATYGDIWGFETDRYFVESDFTGKNANGSWNPAEGIPSQTALENGGFHYGPGDIKFKDLNGDGVINGGDPNMKDADGNPIPVGSARNHGDLKVIGNMMPRYEYSFHIGGTYNGFDLDLFFQGVGKRDVWTISAFNFPMMRDTDLAIYSNQMSYNQVLWNDTYTEITGYEIDQNNDYPRLYPGNDEQGTISTISAGSKNYYPQSKYLTDMSYLRLKNVTLGYTLPRDLTRKAYIEKLRLYVSGQNLFLLHKGSGNLPIDPEVNASSNSNGAYGSWGRVAPITRTYSVGLQVTF